MRRMLAPGSYLRGTWCFQQLCRTRMCRLLPRTHLPDRLGQLGHRCSQAAGAAAEVGKLHSRQQQAQSALGQVWDAQQLLQGRHLCTVGWSAMAVVSVLHSW